MGAITTGRDWPLAGVLRSHPPYLLGVVGALFPALAVAQVLLDPEPLAFQVLELGFPILLSLVLFYGVYNVSSAPEPGERQAHVLLTVGLFALIGSGTVTVVGISELGEGGGLVDWGFAMIAGGAAGASVAIPAGITYNTMISSQRELESEVNRTRTLNERLTVVNRILRHNARNMLSVAQGHLQEAMALGKNRAMIETLERCEESLDSFHKLAEDALQVDRLQRDDSELVALDVEPLVNQAINRAAIRDSEASIRTTIQGTPTIRGRPMVALAIAEAIANALEHNEAAGLEIEILVTTTADTVSIVVADNGTGLPPNLEWVLEHGEETPLYHAEGVGMWLMKWICENAGGEFSLREPDQSGTSLQFRFDRIA